MNKSMFREYDVRGLVGEDLNPESVTAVAKAHGTFLVRRGHTSVVVGRDVRLSSDEFAACVCEGLASTGLKVLDAGVVPTPVLYYAIIQARAGGGVMITGSHNPIEYNGLKLCEGALAIYGDEITHLYELCQNEDFEIGSGTIEPFAIVDRYVEDICERFQFSSPQKVVVDCGNGVTGPLVPRVLRNCGHEVIELYTEPDGNFPNHLPDPEVPAYMVDLITEVKKSGASMGLGFDGDGDRLGLIDENGVKVSADRLLAVFARDLLTRYPGGTVRFDVKCSDYLEDDIREHGGVPIMGRTGHSILKRDMKELDAIIGGELSGHIVFGREFYLSDDPLFCALRALELVEQSETQKCSDLFTGFPETFSTAEIKVPVPEALKFGIVDALATSFASSFEVITIDGVRVIHPQGWGLVRASNTTANLTLRFESRSQEGLEAIRRDFLSKLEKHPELDLSPVMEAF